MSLGPIDFPKLPDLYKRQKGASEIPQSIVYLSLPNLESNNDRSGTEKP